MRKILTGALVLATAAVVSVVSPSADASAALSDSTVKVNAANQTITVNADGYKEIGFSIASVNAKTGIIKSAADSAWEWHDVGADKSVVIDLSSLSNTKDNFVQIKTDTKETMTIKIPAVNTKVKAVYDAAANTVTVLDTTTDKKGVAVADTIEFKNKYGNWSEYEGTASLAGYVYKGAALTFRIAANHSDAIAAQGEKDAKISYQISKTEKEEVPYYVANAFPGKEVKVSVKKLANGPKIAANYVKNTITVPKGAEYRITGVNDSALGDWRQLTDITKAEQLDATREAVVEGTIEVRTKAVAAEGTKAGKPASKISRLSFNAVDVLTVTPYTEGTWTSDEVSAINAEPVKGEVTKATLKQGDKTLPITVEYVTATNKTTGVTSTTAIKIINNSTDAYQVYVNKEADGKAPAIGVRGAVAVGAATVKGEELKAKEVTIKNCDGAQIYITKVGNAKTATWASGFVGLGTVKYPADIVPTPSPAPAEPTEAPAE